MSFVFLVSRCHVSPARGTFPQPAVCPLRASSSSAGGTGERQGLRLVDTDDARLFTPVADGQSYALETTPVLEDAEAGAVLGSLYNRTALCADAQAPGVRS